MFNFRKICRRWKPTVWGDRNMRLATCRLVNPVATSWATSVSVRLLQPVVGRLA